MADSQLQQPRELDVQSAADRQALLQAIAVQFQVQAVEETGVDNPAQGPTLDEGGESLTATEHLLPTSLPRRSPLVSPVPVTERHWQEWQGQSTTAFPYLPPKERRALDDFMTQQLDLNQAQHLAAVAEGRDVRRLLWTPAPEVDSLAVQLLLDQLTHDSTDEDPYGEHHPRLGGRGQVLTGPPPGTAGHQQMVLAGTSLSRREQRSHESLMLSASDAAWLADVFPTSPESGLSKRQRARNRREMDRLLRLVLPLRLTNELRRLGAPIPPMVARRWAEFLPSHLASFDSVYSDGRVLPSDLAGPAALSFDVSAVAVDAQVSSGDYTALLARELPASSDVRAMHPRFLGGGVQYLALHQEPYIRAISAAHGPSARGGAAHELVFGNHVLGGLVQNGSRGLDHGLGTEVETAAAALFNDSLALWAREHPAQAAPLAVLLDYPADWTARVGAQVHTALPDNLHLVMLTHSLAHVSALQLQQVRWLSAQGSRQRLWLDTLTHSFGKVTALARRELAQAQGWLYGFLGDGERLPNFVTPRSLGPALTAEVAAAVVEGRRRRTQLDTQHHLATQHPQSTGRALAARCATIRRWGSWLTQAYMALSTTGFAILVERLVQAGVPGLRAKLVMLPAMTRSIAEETWSGADRVDDELKGGASLRAERLEHLAKDRDEREHDDEDADDSEEADAEVMGEGEPEEVDGPAFITSDGSDEESVVDLDQGGPMVFEGDETVSSQRRRRRPPAASLQRPVSVSRHPEESVSYLDRDQDEDPLTLAALAEQKRNDELASQALAVVAPQLDLQPCRSVAGSLLLGSPTHEDHLRVLSLLLTGVSLVSRLAEDHVALLDAAELPSAEAGQTDCLAVDAAPEHLLWGLARRRARNLDPKLWAPYAFACYTERPPLLQGQLEVPSGIGHVSKPLLLAPLVPVLRDLLVFSAASVYAGQWPRLQGVTGFGQSGQVLQFRQGVLEAAGQGPPGPVQHMEQALLVAADCVVIQALSKTVGELRVHLAPRLPSTAAEYEELVATATAAMCALYQSVMYGPLPGRHHCPPPAGVAAEDSNQGREHWLQHPRHHHQPPPRGAVVNSTHPLSPVLHDPAKGLIGEVGQLLAVASPRKDLLFCELPLTDRAYQESVAAFLPLDHRRQEPRLQPHRLSVGNLAHSFGLEAGQTVPLVSSVIMARLKGGELRSSHITLLGNARLAPGTDADPALGLNDPRLAGFQHSLNSLRSLGDTLLGTDLQRVGARALPAVGGQGPWDSVAAVAEAWAHDTATRSHPHSVNREVRLEPRDLNHRLWSKPSRGLSTVDQQTVIAAIQWVVTQPKRVSLRDAPQHLPARLAADWFEELEHTAQLVQAVVQLGRGSPGLFRRQQDKGDWFGPSGVPGDSWPPTERATEAEDRCVHHLVGQLADPQVWELHRQWVFAPGLGGSVDRYGREHETSEAETKAAARRRRSPLLGFGHWLADVYAAVTLLRLTPFAGAATVCVSTPRCRGILFALAAAESLDCVEVDDSSALAPASPQALWSSFSNGAKTQFLVAGPYGAEERRLGFQTLSALEAQQHWQFPPEDETVDTQETAAAVESRPVFVGTGKVPDTALGAAVLEAGRQLGADTQRALEAELKTRGNTGTGRSAVFVVARILGAKRLGFDRTMVLLETPLALTVKAVLGSHGSPWAAGQRGSGSRLEAKWAPSHHGWVLSLDETVIQAEETRPDHTMTADAEDEKKQGGGTQIEPSGSTNHRRHHHHRRHHRRHHHHRNSHHHDHPAAADAEPDKDGITRATLVRHPCPESDLTRPSIAELNLTRSGAVEMVLRVELVPEGRLSLRPLRVVADLGEHHERLPFQVVVSDPLRDSAAAAAADQTLVPRQARLQLARQEAAQARLEVFGHPDGACPHSRQTVLGCGWITSERDVVGLSLLADTSGLLLGVPSSQPSHALAHLSPAAPAKLQAELARWQARAPPGQLCAWDEVWTGFTPEGKLLARHPPALPTLLPELCRHVFRQANASRVWTPVSFLDRQTHVCGVEWDRSSVRQLMTCTARTGCRTAETAGQARYCEVPDLFHCQEDALGNLVMLVDGSIPLTVGLARDNQGQRSYWLPGSLRLPSEVTGTKTNSQTRAAWALAVAQFLLPAPTAGELAPVNVSRVRLATESKDILGTRLLWHALLASGFRVTNYSRALGSSLQAAARTFETTATVWLQARAPRGQAEDSLSATTDEPTDFATLAQAIARKIAR